MALRALRRNVMRSMLTCLGIIIGIAAVIAMMEIGGGSSCSIQQAIASLGASVIQIDPADVSVGGVSSGRGGRATLTTMEDAEPFAASAASLKYVAPSVDCRGQVVYGEPELAARPDPGRDAGLSCRAQLAGGRGRAVHDGRRAQRGRGVPHRPDDRGEAVRRRVAARQGDPPARTSA